MSLKPPDGATVPVNSFVDVLREAPLNLRYPEFNAKADGSDDTTAISRWLAALQDAPNAEGYAPPGEYLTTGNLIPSTPARVFGGGPGVTIFKLAASAPVLTGPPGSIRAILSNQGAQSTGVSGFVIEGIELDGNVANNHAAESTYGIALYGCDGGTIRNIYAHDLRAEGIFLGAATTSGLHHSDVLIDDVRLKNCGFTNGGSGQDRQGIAVIRGSRIQVRNVRAQTIASHVVDFESNVADDIIEECIVDGVSGYDCTYGVGLYGHASTPALRNIVSNVTVKDGPTQTLTNIVRTTNSTGARIGRIASDPILAVPVLDGGNNLNLRIRECPGESCVATRTANQTSLASGGSGTAVAFDSEPTAGDPDGMHDTVTNNSRVTILTPGWYQAAVTLWWSATTGTTRAAFLRKNGSTMIGDDRKPPSPALATYTWPPVKLAAGDYLEVLAYQDSGGAIDLTRDTNFPMFSVVKVA